MSRYAITHRAMTETARAHGLRASDVWLLAAVVDEGGMTTTDVLERAMHVEGTAIRRSLIVLRPRYLVGGNVTGRRAPIQITTEGVGVIGDMLRLELELEGDGR